MPASDGQNLQDVTPSTSAGIDKAAHSPPRDPNSSSQAAEAAASALKDFARGRPASNISSINSSESRESIKTGDSFTDPSPCEAQAISAQAISARQQLRPTSQKAIHGIAQNLAASQQLATSERRTASPPSLTTYAQPRPRPLRGSSGSSTKHRVDVRSSWQEPKTTGLAVPLMSLAPQGRPLHWGPGPNPDGAKTPSTMPPTTPAASSCSLTPMKLSELGRDYTRYPFPRQDSSYTNFSSPTPLYTPSRGQTPLLSGSTKASPYPSTVNLGMLADHKKADMWLLDDRLGAPYSTEAGGFPLHTDEKEEDDDMHTPRPDDDEKLKPRLKDFFCRRQMGSLLGLVFMFIGIFVIFILLPVLSYTGHAIYGYPYGSFSSVDVELDPNDWVNDVRYPLLKNIRTGLIDPETPESAMKRKTFDGEHWDLVFSDEFTKEGRTFYPGDDPYWTAPDIWYGSTQDLEWYDPDAANVQGGTLQLKLEKFANHGLLYRSGMLNSWNQVCIKGGALDIGVSLAGPGGASGLWPGAWTMGNLGRPGYKASTEGLWPYSYNSCDQGITPNQSMTDGTSYLPGQRLPSCTCPGEDHPTPGTGRGAPEIDVFEASADAALHLGLVTQSYQAAPFDVWWQPNTDFLAIPNFNTTQMNGYCGSPFQEAVSGQTELNNQWYDGKMYQKYGFEYGPGIGKDGYITWFVGDAISFQMTGDAIGPNGNVGYRPISEEPMHMVLNLGFSTAWTGIHMDELRFPTTMYVEYVRWYQKPGEHMVTCDPPGYETTQYIKDHLVAYENNNVTEWTQTGFGWPKHKLNTDNCR